MGVILGTVAGWQRDDGWTSENRVYIGPGYEKEYVSLLEPRFMYDVTINITIYTCDSPIPDDPLVIRRINGIRIVSISDEEYSGGLDAFIEDKTEKEAEELASRTLVEIAGLILCDTPYKIEIVDKHFEEIRLDLTKRLITAERMKPKRLITARRIRPERLVTAKRMS